MNFLAPELLLGLLLVPVAIGFYLWAQRRRTKYAVRFTNLALLANLAPKRPSWRRHLPPALYLAAIAALLIGLARPTMVMAVPREDATVILTMDVSGSMKANDVSPTRLDAAREAALNFINQLPAKIRVGLVAFASEPVTLVQPTTDRDQVKSALDSLRPLDGTAMGDALNQVLDIAQKIQAEANVSPDGSTAPPASPAPSSDPAATPAPGASGAPTDRPAGQPLVAAILLSDGANSVGQTEPQAAADRAATMGVPIYTIALGTPDGTVDVRDNFGQMVTLPVPPDKQTLQQIADTTGGKAFDAPTAEDLKQVYANLESRIGFTQETQEVTFAFVGAGLLLVVAGAGLAAVWFGRLP
jgi:Ca-activated chloride channel homolog